MNDVIGTKLKNRKISKINLYKKRNSLTIAVLPTSFENISSTYLHSIYESSLAFFNISKCCEKYRFFSQEISPINIIKNLNWH